MDEETMMGAEHTARAGMLRDFMRTQRSHRTPEELGLHAPHGRRAGVSQDDLAQLIGYTPRMVGLLEQGRLPRPSPAFLEAIASALRMNVDERQIFWELAAGTPPPAHVDYSPADPGLIRMVEEFYPNPAYVTDVAWNVEACNQGVMEWFTDFHDTPPEDRNIAKWIFLDPHARHVFVDWENGFARMFIARMRAIRAQLPGDPRLRQLIEELCARSPDAARLWHGASEVYFDPPTETRVFRAPGHTDPDQQDDKRHHVPLDMVIVSPRKPGDERRLVAFLLPEEFRKPRTVMSEQACAACARLARGQPEHS